MYCSQSLGSKIRDCRIKANLDKKQMAKLLNCNMDQVLEIELGKLGISEIQLKKFAEAVGVKESLLLK